VRPTSCGLDASGVSPIAIDADSAAATLGWKVTPTWHEAPPARVAPHGVVVAVVSEKSAALAPLITGVGSVRVAAPRFVINTVSAFDLVRATVPNASVVAGVNRTGVTPVPDSAIKCGLVGS